jgi:hypothetical protein
LWEVERGSESKQPDDNNRSLIGQPLKAQAAERLLLSLSIIFPNN